MQKSIFKIYSLIIFLFAFGAVSLNAQSPSETIKKANNRIIEAQKGSKTQAQANIRKILDEFTGYNLIAENVKKAVCSGIDAKKSQEFLNAFLEYIKTSYASKLAKYNVASIEYIGETKSGDKTIVKTKVKVADKSAKIDYELEKINNKWLITNYIIDDINTIENYKKQFQRTLKKESIDSLITSLKKKTDELKNGK